jgi:serine/threonine-protein kinase
VFEAQDRAGRTVALKAFTHPACENRTLRERLLSDARAAGAIGHPNLAAFVDAGEHQGRPFVVTEMVEGADLARTLRSDLPLPLEWILDVLRQITVGLQEAHRQGLVHLDLKPTDVRVTAEGDVKILDFGVTHLKSVDAGGGGGSFHGIHYRAPELIEGRRPDGRADVFSVGALAYELATRRRAFPGDDPAAVMLRIRRAAPDLGALPNTAYSPRFEEVVAKSLRREPAERYGSMGEMHDELVALVRDLAPRLLAGSASVEAPALVPDPSLPEAPIEIRLEDEPGAPAPAEKPGLELEAAIQGGEVERLCGLSLAYAADGELGLARKIADRIRNLAPNDPRGARLDSYLDEEDRRRAALGGRPK